MNIRMLSFVALAIALTGVPALAGEKGKPDGERRQRILEKFDSDGDGKLNEEERAAAREAREAKKGEMRAKILEKFDSDGDGKLNEEERAAARAERGKQGGKRRGGPMRAMVMNPDQAFQRLDADGDGVLSRSEFQTLVDRMQQAAEKMKGKRKGRGRGDQ